MDHQESRDYGLLERLADEFADRHRRGERPSIQEYLDKYPALADDLRDVLPAMAEMEKVQEVIAAPSAVAPPTDEQRLLGDFRILREIGRGGMGVVYEAERLRPRPHALRTARAAPRVRREGSAPAHQTGDILRTGAAADGPAGGAPRPRDHRSQGDGPRCESPLPDRGRNGRGPAAVHCRRADPSPAANHDRSRLALEPSPSRHRGTRSTVLLLMIGVTIASIFAANHFGDLARIAKEIAESERIAKENAAKERAAALLLRDEAERQKTEADTQRNEAKRQVARQYGELANRLIGDGDASGALLWNVEALKAYPEQSEAVRTRIGLLLRQAPLPIHSLFHDSAIQSMHLDPSGRAALVTLENKQAILYDLESGKPRFALPADLGAISQLEFSKDGTKLATVSVGEPPQPGPNVAPPPRPAGQTFPVETPSPYFVRVWDTANGKPMTPPIPTEFLGVGGPGGGGLGGGGFGGGGGPFGGGGFNGGFGLAPRGRSVQTTTDKLFCLGDSRILVRTDSGAFKLFESATGKEGPTVNLGQNGSRASEWEISSDGGKLLLQVIRTEGGKPGKEGPEPFTQTRVCSVVDLESNASSEIGVPQTGVSPVVKLSPDGRFVLAVSSMEARLYEINGKERNWSWKRPDDDEQNGRLGGLGGGGGFRPGGGPGFGGNRESFTHLFSSDGRVVVYKDSKGTYALHTATMKVVNLGTTIVTLNELGPRGQYLLARTADRHVVYDTATGILSNQLPPEVSPLTLKLSPDGRYVAATGEGTSVQVFEASSGRRAIPMLTHEAPVSQLGFTADGSRLVTTSGTTLRVWPLVRGEAGRTLGAGFTDFAVSPDGDRIVTVTAMDAQIKDYDSKIEAWDARSGKSLFPAVRIQPEKDEIRAFSPLNAVSIVGYSASGNRVLLQWRQTPPLRIGADGSYTSNDALYKNWVLDLTDGRVQVWRPADTNPDASDTWSRTALWAWTPAGESVLRIVSYRQRTRSFLGSRPPADLGGPPKPVLPTTARPKATLALLRPDGSALGEPLTFTGSLATAWSRDGRRLAVVAWDNSEARLSLWSHQPGEPLQKLRDDFAAITIPATPDADNAFGLSPFGVQPTRNGGPNVAFSSDGKRLLFWVARGSDVVAKVFDAAAGTQVGSVEIANSSTTPRLSPDGAILYASSVVKQNTGVLAINVSDGTNRYPMLVQESLSGFDLSPDGRRLLTQGQKTIQVWNTENGILATTPLTHELRFVTAVFTADSQRVIASVQGEDDNFIGGRRRRNFNPLTGRYFAASDIRIWDALSGQPVLTGLGDTDRFGYDDNGRRMFRMNAAGALSIQDVVPDRSLEAELQQLAETLASRNVSGGGGLVVLESKTVAAHWEKSALARAGWGATLSHDRWHNEQIQNYSGGNSGGNRFRFFGTSISTASARWHLDRSLARDPKDREKRLLRATLAVDLSEWAQVVADLKDEPADRLDLYGVSNRAAAYAEIGDRWDQAHSDYLKYADKIVLNSVYGNVARVWPLSMVAIIELKQGKTDAAKRRLAETEQMLVEARKNPDPKSGAPIDLYVQLLWPALLMPDTLPKSLVDSIDPKNVSRYPGGFGAGTVTIPLDIAVFYRQNKYDEVVKMLKPQFATKAGCSIPQCFFLAMAAKKTKDDALAKQALDRAIALIAQAGDDPKLLFGDSPGFGGATIWQTKVTHELLLKEAKMVVGETP